MVGLILVVAMLGGDAPTWRPLQDGRDAIHRPFPAPPSPAGEQAARHRLTYAAPWDRACRAWPARASHVRSLHADRPRVILIQPVHNLRVGHAVIVAPRAAVVQPAF